MLYLLCPSKSNKGSYLWESKEIIGLMSSCLTPGLQSQCLRNRKGKKNGILNIQRINCQFVVTSRAVIDTLLTPGWQNRAYVWEVSSMLWYWYFLLREGIVKPPRWLWQTVFSPVLPENKWRDAISGSGKALFVVLPKKISKIFGSCSSAGSITELF